MFCKKCGNEIPNEAKFCTNCGTAVQPVPENGETGQTRTPEQASTAIVQPQVVVYTQPPTGINPNWPLKSKIAAGLLGIFLGGLGIHKFYLGHIGSGIAYIVFCWTCIPAFIGFIEGIVYLCSSDENFQMKHHMRLE